MRILLRLAGYAVRVSPQRLVLAYICVIGATILSLAIPRLLGTSIDRALGSESTSVLVLMAVLVLVASLVGGAFHYGQTYISEYISQNAAYRLRSVFLARLQALSFGFHDRQKTGDLMSRAAVDVESVRWFVSFGLIYSVHILVLVVGVSVLLLTISWDMALLGLSAVPVAVFIAVKMSRRFRSLWREVQTDTGKMTTVLQENLSGMRVVKTFGAEEQEKEKFREAAEVVAEKTFTVNRLHAANSSLLSLMFTLVTAGVVWYGGSKIIDGYDPVTGLWSGQTPGELTQFVLYLGLLVFPIRMSGWVVNNYSRAISSGERIFEVLDAQSPVEEKPGAVTLGRATGRVAFEAVQFSYGSYDSRDGAGPAPSVLQDLNLEVAPGHRIALLGAPGSGKSSMVSLIPRFYDVTAGRTTVDGWDVRDLTLESLRSNVGVVPQDVFLFMASLRDNISYGVPGASLEQVMGVARAAQIHDFIMGLPEQYDTLVGERGITLSGGQRQRVALARTLLMDPPILILDDSTSSVDAETEFLINRALEEVMRGRTTFVIAHRINTLRSADLILVVEHGEIVERGTHEELITRPGLYREIYQIQLRAEEDIMVESSAGDDGG